jgi:hypothetical protein
MARTDRQLTDSEKAMLLRLGHQSVSTTVAPDVALRHRLRAGVPVRVRWIEA